MLYIEVEQLWPRWGGSLIQTNLTNVLKDAPRGEWLALSHDEDRLIASAVLIEDAFAAARAMGEDNPVMMKVPPEGLLVL